MTKPAAWSAEAKRLALPIYESIIELPFVKALADGSLDMDKFLFYIRQDALYLDTYARVLAHAGARMPSPEMMERFLEFSIVGVAVERELHGSYLGGVEPDYGEISPECLLYTAWHKSHAYDAVEVEAAGLLPCFTIYGDVGSHIMLTASHDNPFKKWIDTYGDKAFLESCDKACGICDALAEKASPDVRAKMTDAFIMASKMEWMFWDSAWRKSRFDI